MPIDDIIEKAIEQAFAKALDQALQKRAEALFTKAFEDGSPFAKKLEERIDRGFQHLFEEGIRWEKRKPGFKK